MNRENVSTICKAMGDSNRLKIVESLSDGEKCACHLLEELDITQPTLSHHMAAHTFHASINVIHRTDDINIARDKKTIFEFVRLICY